MMQKPSSGWLERGSPEWEYAWNHFGDRVMEDQESGEVLQYMGSMRRGQYGTYYHTFRHRQCPYTGQREYWHIPARPGWHPTPEEALGDDLWPKAN